jgi:hypothetical protein
MECKLYKGGMSGDISCPHCDSAVDVEFEGDDGVGGCFHTPCPSCGKTITIDAYVELHYEVVAWS